MIIIACGKCRFWHPLSDDSGECRRYPPSVVVDVSSESSSDGGSQIVTSNVATAFPTIGRNGWCGEAEWNPEKAHT